MDWKSIPPHSERWHGWLDPWLVSRVGAPLSEAPMPLPSNGRLTRNEEKGWGGGGESYLLTTLSTHESMIINSLLKPFESFTRIGRAGREVEMGRLMTGCRPAPSFAPPGPQALRLFLWPADCPPARNLPSLYCPLPPSLTPALLPGEIRCNSPLCIHCFLLNRLHQLSWTVFPGSRKKSNITRTYLHLPNGLGSHFNCQFSLHIYPWSFESSAKKKQFYLGQLTQMWVGRAGWTQTFINYSFYGTLGPFFVKNFR